MDYVAYQMDKRNYEQKENNYLRVFVAIQVFFFDILCLVDTVFIVSISFKVCIMFMPSLTPTVAVALCFRGDSKLVGLFLLSGGCVYSRRLSGSLMESLLWMVCYRSGSLSADSVHLHL